MNENIGRLQSALTERQIPSLLLSDISNVQWASGFTGSSAFILLSPKDCLFITDSRYTVQSKEELPGMNVAIYSSPTDSASFIGQEAAKMGLSKIGFEADTVTYAQYESWKKKLDPITLEPVTNFVEPLRMVKSKSEIDKIRAACKLADACFDHVIRMVQPGVTEFDLGLEIEFFFRRHGAEVGFPPIVVSGVRSARPHGRPSEKKLEKGDFVTFDFGCTLNGYNSDMTRTVVVQEASPRHVEIYNAVLDSQLKGIDACKSGVTGADVDRASRDLLAQHSLDKYFGHGLGHGLGKSVHDFGRLNPTSKDKIEPGQVWTIEPGVYIEGFGGVRIEDDVVVTETGNEILNHSTKELLVLPK